MNILFFLFFYNYEIMTQNSRYIILYDIIMNIKVCMKLTYILLFHCLHISYKIFYSI